MPTSGFSAALSDYERERGKPEPTLLHAIVQANLGVKLQEHAADKYQVLSELDLEFPNGSRLTPDLSVVKKQPIDWQHDQLRYRQPPCMVVEIPLFSQTYQSAMDKVDIYLANGVQSAWVVHTGLQTIGIYLPTAKRPRRLLSRRDH